MLQRQPDCFALAQRTTVALFALIGAILLLASVSQPAQSQTYQVIHNFTFYGGATPYGGPVFDRFGNMWGTDYTGGSYGSGGVYKLSRQGSSWSYSLVYSLKGQTDGAGPAFGTLAIGPSGTLFGTTEGGGYFGTTFAICPYANCAWIESVVYNFQGLDDAQNPVGGLILDAAGNLYGTTFDGGINGGGTVYQFSPSGAGGTFTTLYSFVGGYGGPYNKLTLDAKGNLYGTLNGESVYGYGSVFKLTPGTSGWTYTD